MEYRELERGDVVQICPEPLNAAFGGCMLIVTECKPGLVMGYVQGLGETRYDLGGQAFIRLPWAQVEFVGRATWIIYGGESDDEHE